MEVDFAKMSIPADVAEFSKRWEAGQYDHMTKAFWHRVITEQAEKTCKAGESRERAFTRLIVSDPAGRALFKAYQRAPNGDLPKVAKVDGGDFIGPHAGRLHVEATARARERAITYSAGVYEVLQKDPALSAAVREEHLAFAMSAMGGAGGVDHTLSISEAQRKEPARSFSGTGYDASIARKSAESELEKLAHDFHAKHAEISYERAFAKVLIAPEHRALMKRSHDERVARLGVRMAV
jgi:hypothetical protein